MSRGNIYKKTGLQEKISKLFAVVCMTPSDKIINADLRKELATLLQNKNDSSNKAIWKLPSIANGPREGDSGIQ